MSNTVIVTLRIHKEKKEIDVEIPLDITINELLNALNEAYNLNIDTSNIRNCFLKTENPIRFIKGNKLLYESGIRNGSIINIS